MTHKKGRDFPAFFVFPDSSCLLVTPALRVAHTEFPGAGDEVLLPVIMTFRRIAKRPVHLSGSDGVNSALVGDRQRLLWCSPEHSNLWR